MKFNVGFEVTVPDDKNVPPVLLKTPATLKVIPDPLAPFAKSNVPPVCVKLFALTVYPLVPVITNEPVFVDVTVNVPATPVVPLLPKLTAAVCKGQFQVKLLKFWVNPPVPAVFVVYPETRVVLLAFHKAVGIVPATVVYLCS